MSDGPVTLAFSFVIELMIRGYHEYVVVWENPVYGEILVCHREVGNAHDTHAVAVKKVIGDNLKVVGHISRRISSMCSIFLRRGAEIKCTVNGGRCYSSDLLQGGLEIPCLLTFIASTSAEGMKTKKLIELLCSSEKLTNQRRSTAEVANQQCQPTAGVVSQQCQPTAGAVSQQPRPMAGVAKQQCQPNAGVVTQMSQPMEEAALLPVMCDQNEDDVISVSDNKSDIASELSPPKKKSENYDVESIIMGDELSDLIINYAQEILKLQFKKLNGFHSTHSQGKVAQWSQNEGIKSKLPFVQLGIT